MVNQFHCGKFEFRLSEERDRQNIKELFKEHGDVLSIPFTEIIDRCIWSDSFYVCYRGEEFVGMGGMKYSKKKDEYAFEHVAITQKYKDKGFGVLIFYFLLKNTPYKKKTLLGEKEIPIIAYAREGAENNTLYDRMCKSYTVDEKKTRNIRRYVIDTERFLNQCQFLNRYLK